MLDVAILGLLKERAMHGYELKKELTAQLGQFWQVSYGSLYPTIRRLEKGGALQRVFPKQEVGRRKNIYRITEDGEKRFSEALTDEVGVHDDASFGTKFAFFRYMKPSERVEVLETRRAYLKAKLAEMREKLRSYRERIDAYTYRLMEHGVDTTSAEMAWIDKLLAEEKSQGTGDEMRRS